MRYSGDLYVNKW